jgi:toxin ParE1/3/4
MRNFIVSPNAAEDLNEIWEYVAHEWGEPRADQTLHELVTAFGDLAKSPGVGHLRQDLTSLRLHFFTLDSYLIVYTRDTSPLPIHAVMHSSRNIRKLLRKRPLT